MNLRIEINIFFFQNSYFVQTFHELQNIKQDFTTFNEQK